MRHCQNCSLEYGLEGFCTKCGNELKNGLLLVQAVESRHICGECGRIFASNEQYCGSCGISREIAVSKPYVYFRPEDASVDGM